MRLLSAVLFFSVIVASPANAQPANPGWEVGLGPHVIFREASSSTHAGGGVTVARRFEKLAIVVEGSGTRRQGHNDWRAAGGPRLIFGADARSSYFIQALAGALIRQKESTWSVLPGVGVDVKVGTSKAIRFQIDAPIERSETRTTTTSIRGSIWFIF